VNTPSVHEQRQAWAFWIAAVLAFAGGLAPIVFAGISGRISGAIIPFWIAAIVFGVCARYRRLSRSIAVVLYFIAGLATVYAMLQLVSLPLRMTLLGTCPPSPSSCLPGMQQRITEGEQTGLLFGVGIGVVAIFVGYFGLFNLFRRPRANAAPSLPVGMTPPVRTIPPVEDSPEKESKPADPAAPIDTTSPVSTINPVEDAPEKESKPTDPAPPTPSKE
jgi:hypothetical protein